MNAAYALRHEDFQMVEITLAKGDRVVGTTKDMMYMEPGISRDQGQSPIVEYINDDFVQRKIAFGSPYISKIVPIELSAEDVPGIYFMNDAFLCAAQGASITMGDAKRTELVCKDCQPFELRAIQGDGTVFLSSVGTVIRRQLQEDEIIRVEMDCLLAMSHEIQYDYQIIGKGCECNCIATVAGPGTLWLQTTSFATPNK